MRDPNGVIADTISRRLSVIIGYGLIGGGLTLEGTFASFFPILAAQAIWGIGYTFTSGAEAAWLADEVGEERAAGLYLRGAQFSHMGSFLGIGLAVALTSIKLNLPLLAGGIGFVSLAIALIATMPETGFSPTPRGNHTTWATLGTTFSEGVQTVRRRPGIGIIFIIAGIFGAASSDFALAAGAYWGVVLLRRLNAPLSVAWLNQGLDPRSRATMLSMQSQSDAFGQVVGGPVLGAIASLTSVRLALVIAGLVLSPALWLYRRAGRQRLLQLDTSGTPSSGTSVH